jgi:predicted lipid-binding transport protein (Tim44 family)
MNLQTLLAAALALLVGGLLALPDTAEAKRFGGGGNLGRQSQSMPRQAQPAQPQAKPQTQTAAPAQRPPQTGGASRWLGPLAGLAAGGLLASLFFGDGFEGLQIMDFVLIALLVGGGIFLFRMLRRGQARPAAPAAAYGAAGAAAAPQPQAGVQARESAAALGGGRGIPGLGATPPQPAGADRFPFWFDGPGFVEGAKTHYIRLQAAWDQADFRDIRDYTTPALFAELQRERERLGAKQYTEVVRLQSELLTIQRDGDLAVASIRFHGLIREDEQAVAEPFDEVWHVQHPWDSPDGDWLIAGIQQQG